MSTIDAPPPPPSTSASAVVTPAVVAPLSGTAVAAPLPASIAAKAKNRGRPRKENDGLAIAPPVLKQFIEKAVVVVEPKWLLAPALNKADTPSPCARVLVKSVNPRCSDRYVVWPGDVVVLVDRASGAIPQRVLRAYLVLQLFSTGTAAALALGDVTAAVNAATTPTITLNDDIAALLTRAFVANDEGACATATDVDVAALTALVRTVDLRHVYCASLHASAAHRQLLELFSSWLRPTQVQRLFDPKIWSSLTTAFEHWPGSAWHALSWVRIVVPDAATHAKREDDGGVLCELLVWIEQQQRELAEQLKQQHAAAAAARAASRAAADATASPSSASVTSNNRQHADVDNTDDNSSSSNDDEDDGNRKAGHTRGGKRSAERSRTSAPKRAATATATGTSSSTPVRRTSTTALASRRTLTSPAAQPIAATATAVITPEQLQHALVDVKRESEREAQLAGLRERITTAEHARDVALGERDAAIAARTSALAERDAAIAVRTTALAERDVAVAQVSSLQRRLAAARTAVSLLAAQAKIDVPEDVKAAIAGNDQ